MKNRFSYKEICCEDCLAAEMIEALDELDEFGVVSLYAKAEVVAYMIKHCLALDYDIALLDFDSDGLDYADTYIFTVDNNAKIWVEPAYRDSKPINTESEYVFLYEPDCDEAIIDTFTDSHEPNQIAILFSFEGEEQPDAGEEMYQKLVDDKGELTGFEYSHTDAAGETSTYYKDK